MKAKRKLLGLFPLAAILLMASCSSDEPDSIDFNLIESINSGSKTVCYQRQESSQLFVNTGYGFKPYDISNWSGLVYDPAYRIIFQDGLMLVRESLLECEFVLGGLDIPKQIGLITQAYIAATHNNFEFYLAIPFAYDNEKQMMTINGSSYEVITFNDNEINLKNYFEGTSNSGVSFKAMWDNHYSRIAMEPIKKDMIYRSSNDLYRKIIALCREHFGDKVSLNDVYKDDINFSHEYIIDLNELEIELGL